MMKLAEEHGVEACISKTDSYEYWDEMPSSAKVGSMAEYLHDVRVESLDARKAFDAVMERSLPYGSSEFSQNLIFLKVVSSESRSPPSRLTHQNILNTCTGS